jgi:dihydrofolate reductase
MSKVIAIMSMSLDGYVADRNGGLAEVMGWYMTSGDTEVQTGGSDPMTLKMSEASARHFRDLTSELGSVLTGRRTFETADGWGGNHAWGPAFVLTHRVPAGWPRPNSTVNFVTDGIESAVKQAKAAAAEKSVGSTARTRSSSCSTLDYSTKSMSISRHFFLALEFDSLTTLLPHQPFWAIRRSLLASA